MNEQHKSWWRFINWLWEMCRTGQRTWEHPKSEEKILELKTYFEETYSGWKKGDAVRGVTAAKDEMPQELPF